jgi:preprotein translocase subunit SecE
VRRRQ